MATELKKLYAGISDMQMLENLQTILDLYTADMLAFTNYDNYFNDTYRLESQTAIDNARAIPTDETTLNVITELTKTVKKAWDNCTNHFQSAKYFIEKAFPDNKARQNVFGFSDYGYMAREQYFVLPFMEQFGEAAIQYQTQLIAVGYTQPQIDAIATLAAIFKTAQRAQLKYKKARLEITQNRTEAMNLVWTKIKLINTASKSIYRTNSAKLQQYLMPAAASNEHREALSLSGTIINTLINLPEANVTVALPAIPLATTTDTKGRYGFAAGLTAGDTPIEAVKKGFIPYNSSVTLIEKTPVIHNFQLTPR